MCRSRGVRGIALITVLMLSGVLLTLIGAFVSVNRASSRLTGDSLNRSKAQDACIAMLNQAWFELEVDDSFGADTASLPGYSSPVDLPDTGPIPPRIRLQEDFDADGRVFLRGLFSDDGSFNQYSSVRTEMRIFNNLASRHEMQTLDNEIGVAPRSVRIKVKAVAGSASRELDVMLRRQALTNESLMGGDIATLAPNASLLRFESKDPYVNRIKARELALAPESATRFTARGEASVADGNPLKLGAVNLATNPGALASAEDVTGGQFTPNGAEPEVPEVADDELAIPDNEIDIPDGEYKFGDLDHTEFQHHIVGYDKTIPNPDGPGTTTVTAYTDRYQKKIITYTSLEGPDGNKWVSENGIGISYDPPQPPNYGEENYGYANGEDPSWEDGGAYTQRDVQTIFGTAGAGVTVNLASGQMTISPGVTVNADGPNGFQLTAEGGTDPQLLFGYGIPAGGVPMQESLRDGLEAAQNNPATYMAALKTQGDFRVAGDAAGYGSVISGGNLEVRASSGLRSAPELGVVIKGETVTVNPARDPEPGFPGEPTDVDYSAFRDAITTYAGGDWSTFETWLDLTAAQRGDVIGTSPGQALRATELPNNANHYYDRLKAEMGLTLPPPDFAAQFGPEWSGPFTLEHYGRLKEWMQTVASGFNKGNGDESWMHFSQRVTELGTRLENQLSSHANWADSYQVSLQDYLGQPQQIVPDMFFEGLLYAGDGGLTVNGAGHSVRLVGALVSKGPINVDGDRVEIVYSRDILEDLFKESAGKKHLEQVFFNMN